MPRSVFAAITSISLVLPLLICPHALAQIQSEVDTMRIVVDPVIGRGHEIDVDVNLRVVDTLGGFAYRLRYDTSIFDPVQDTFVNGSDTVVGIVVTDLHPGHLEQFAGSVREPGVITFLGVDLDFDTASLYLPGSWPTVRMRWRVRGNALLGATDIYFENDSIFPATWNAISDWWGDDFVRPVLTNATTSVDCACECRADPSLCDGSLDITDVVRIVQVAFANGPELPDPNPLCPITRTDVDCDGETGVLDVIKLIEVAFRNGDPTQVFCNPCE